MRYLDYLLLFGEQVDRAGIPSEAAEDGGIADVVGMDK